MINVLGLEVDRAKALLEGSGWTVTLDEARSKKGVSGGTDARVIRQTQTGESTAALVYSVFRTEPLEQDTEPDDSRKK